MLFDVQCSKRPLFPWPVLEVQSCFDDRVANNISRSYLMENSENWESHASAQPEAPKVSKFAKFNPNAATFGSFAPGGQVCTTYHIV